VAFLAVVALVVIEPNPEDFREYCQEHQLLSGGGEGGGGLLTPFFGGSKRMCSNNGFARRYKLAA